MSWPPNLLDLNQIGPIWEVMGQQLIVQRPPIHNISDLRDRCLNIWYNVSSAIYQGLVASMPRQLNVMDVENASKWVSYDASGKRKIILHAENNGNRVVARNFDTDETNMHQ
ncbi:transposase domain containing protein [Trichonephila clavipes]|uniref:Transposase domain containing protein n=1 Tax=Trichonephila clavipes TaxID=2585209 RepID=A0A8X6USX3_TRICX|nr:transposase domain containing protein [Trichonephila clavipes]